MVLVGVLSFAFGVVVGILIGYWRMAYWLATHPNSVWWTFIRDVQGKYN